MLPKRLEHVLDDQGMWRMRTASVRYQHRVRSPVIFTI